MLYLIIQIFLWSLRLRKHIFFTNNCSFEFVGLSSNCILITHWFFIWRTTCEILKLVLLVVSFLMGIFCTYYTILASIITSNILDPFAQLVCNSFVYLCNRQIFDWYINAWFIFRWLEEEFIWTLNFWRQYVRHLCLP